MKLENYNYRLCHGHKKEDFPLYKRSSTHKEKTITIFSLKLVRCTKYVHYCLKTFMYFLKPETVTLGFAVRDSLNMLPAINTALMTQSPGFYRFHNLRETLGSGFSISTSFK